MTPMQFWYDFASPYAWLAAERLATARGVAVEWVPFIIGPILRLRPDNPSPLQNAPPAQRAYRRRDVERLAAKQGLPLRWPSNYPRNGLLGARVARVVPPDRCPGLTLAIYRASFVEDREIAETDVIRDVLARAGFDAQGTLEAALAEDNKKGLGADVERAIALGIFGAPSFIVGGELFWGNDRLDLALDWARKPWLSPNLSRGSA
jgi:2-hydroxychromene-2-carboxylate isomerase